MRPDRWSQEHPNTKQPTYPTHLCKDQRWRKHEEDQRERRDTM